jgi:hypothetical protein
MFPLQLVTQALQKLGAMVHDHDNSNNSACSRATNKQAKQVCIINGATASLTGITATEP